MTAGISTRTVQSRISRVRLQALTAQIPRGVFFGYSLYSHPIRPTCFQSCTPASPNFFRNRTELYPSLRDIISWHHCPLPSASSFYVFCRNLWRKSDLFIWSFALKQKTLQRRDDFKFKSHVKRMTERHSGAEINSRYHHLRRWTTKSCIIVCLHSENRRQATWIYYARCFSRFTADN